MATTSFSSQRNEYYKWRAIGFAALAAGLLFWYLFLQKKGVYGLFVIILIVSIGVTYFKYESGYVPWYLRTYGGWR
jgi:hypothetical protein